MANINDAIKMQIYIYCQAVQTGNKPVANMLLQTRYIDKAKKIILKHGLNLYVENIKENENWKSIFIYKHKYLIDIIKNIPDNPTTIYEHWILGKLFGYSDEAIGEFINTNSCKNNYKIFDN